MSLTSRIAAAAAVALSSALAAPAVAQPAGGAITRITLINVLPGAAGKSVDALFNDLVAATRRQPGLLQVGVTRQVGQPYNFVLVERWQDQAALDAAAAATATKKFEQAIAPLLSGPSYERTFRTFE